MKIYRQCSFALISVLLTTPHSLAQHSTDSSGFVANAVRVDNNAAPIRVKNTLPIMQGSGLRAPKTALLIPTGEWNLEFQSNVESHANSAARDGEALILDGEVQTLRALLQWKFNSRWQANLEIEGVRNTAGKLDSIIDRWHDTFGLNDGDRDLFQTDQLRFEYTDSSGSQVLTDRASGLGDIGLGLSYQALSNNQFDLSLHADLNLGRGRSLLAEDSVLTAAEGSSLAEGSLSAEGSSLAEGSLSAEGSATELGSNKSDVSVSFALGSVGNGAVAWHANGGVLFIGDDTLFGAATKSTVGFTSLGLHWRPGRQWRWTAQLDGHQAIFNSAIPELNQTAWQLAIGLEYAKRWQVYFTEDLSVNRAADFSVGIRWRYSLSGSRN